MMIILKQKNNNNINIKNNILNIYLWIFFTIKLIFWSIMCRQAFYQWIFGCQHSNLLMKFLHDQQILTVGKQIFFVMVSVPLLRSLSSKLVV